MSAETMASLSESNKDKRTNLEQYRQLIKDQARKGLRCCVIPLTKEEYTGRNCGFILPERDLLSDGAKDDVTQLEQDKFNVRIKLGYEVALEVSW